MIWTTFNLVTSFHGCWWLLLSFGILFFGSDGETLRDSIRA